MKNDKEIQKEILENGNMPKHVAIIMDGNGRWAKARSLPRVAGHHEGINSVRDIVEACGELGIDYLTLYTFSTENWKRPRWEVSALMKLLLTTIKKELRDLMKNNVRVQTIGQLEDLPEGPRESMISAMKETAENTGLTLNLALSYGGRREILDAVQNIAKKVSGGKLSPHEIDEKVFSGELYTKSLPDPDLLIRTSGEARISNFLLWQLAYTEIYITEILWPDFRRKQLYDALKNYQGRERRFGLVKTDEPPG